VTFIWRWIRPLPGRAVSDLLQRWQGNLRLRTRLLFSFVFLTAALTSATLFVVRWKAQTQVQHQIEQDARNAALTFEEVQQQQQTALSRKADLLAWLAYMRNGDATAIQDASEDPWRSDDCNLFVLADKSGKIIALHSTGPTFPVPLAQEMVSSSLARSETSGWWFSNKSLYQVALQPFYDGGARKKNLLGIVVMGRLIDEKVAADLGRIASSEVVFRRGGRIVASTLPALKEMELQRQFHDSFSTTHVFLENKRYYASSVELTPGLQPAADLVVLKSYDEAEAFLRRLNRLFLGLGLAAIIAGGALIFLISDSVTRPLALLMEGVHAVERGDFAYSLEVSGQDELSELTRAFDGMRSTLQRNETQREQLEGQLRQAQKMEALGRLAGGVAHDFNNLLTVIRGHSELLLDRLRPGDPLSSNAQQIQKTADRAAALTRQMLAFSRMQVLQPKVIDLNELIADMGKLLRRLIREDIEFSLRLGNSLARVKADPGQLEQVLLNLTVNASDAMPLGGKLIVETQNVIVDKLYARRHPSVEPGAYVLVSVSDSGQGMDAATKARIFEPFFTTKEPGRGTGLGLATVYGVVKQSGGFILVESSPGNGSKFEIFLPRTLERVESVETFTNGNGCSAPKKTVLVVEDEREVRELACEFLKDAGYNVLSAGDGLEAVETAERMGKSIHLVLTDIVMPKMRGPALARRLKTLLPHVKIVYMTGYLAQNGENDDYLLEAFFLQKPFSRHSLVAQVAEALKKDKQTRPQAQPHPQPVLV
jgi:signal transduction histidine kinase/ActR/RegA family two-component response regulator